MNLTPSRQPVTIIVPTYREAQNIPHLVRRLQAVRDSTGLDLDLLFVDDDSGDGSEQLVRSLRLPWVEIIVRTARRGLSDAVLDGLRHSTRDTVVVMDADLSHPPEKVPELLAAIAGGADVAVGSRFIEGGSTDDDWGFFRWMNSRVATILAMPLTHLRDPMSGFFAMRRSTFTSGKGFDPVGYKILLELIVRCRCQRLVEIPIHFADRRFGESKLSVKEQLRYIQHLRRLYICKYGVWSHLAQFLVVGLTGLVLNLLLLTVFLRLRLPDGLAVAVAVGLSMLWNFALNRRFSFSYSRSQAMLRQLIGFVGACSIGAVVNYYTTLGLWESFEHKQTAAAAGVLAGTAFNFVASRFFVFRKTRVKIRDLQSGSSLR
jgi:dolichol-phosphate mannosyltransferase